MIPAPGVLCPAGPSAIRQRAGGHFDGLPTSRQLAWFSSGLTNRAQLYVGRGPGATSQ